jgi:hypothetical protein
MAGGRAGNAGGFVLVGVVMFVLALTILGLSLFSLSGYEAEFLAQSHDSGQALETALSGVQHARFVLARRRNLEDVGTYLFPEGVVYSRARRTDGSQDSTGSLDAVPPGEPIEIRVLADVIGERRMVQTHVLPIQTPQIYKRLMTITDSLYARSDAAGGGSACGRYNFFGQVWEGGAAGNAWMGCVNGESVSPLPQASIPVPDLASFFAKYLAGATDIQVGHTGTVKAYTIPLVGPDPPPSVNYFRTIDNPGPDMLSDLHIPLYVGFENKILVDGWVVWMLPRGLRLDGHFVVEGTADDCLIIVAGKSYDDDAPPTPNARFGIEFSASLTSANVPVILVTDRWVFLEHFAWSSQPSGASYISVFAKGASFWGPSGSFMTLSHAPGDPRDAPGGLIDQLCEQGALPNSESGSVRFQPVAGTWQELDPDHPPQ